MMPEILQGQPLDDIEALVRLAGDYVQPSDDLRPRVLEAARIAANEKRAKRQIARLAAVFLLVAGSVAALSSGGPGEARGFASPLGLVPPQADMQLASEDNRSGWEMVESFTELRRQQARLLRLAL